MSDGPTADPINAATLELLERRIGERVTEKARGQIFKYYAVVGTTVMGVLGLVGVNAVEWVKTTASAKVDEQVKVLTRDVTAKSQELTKQQAEMERRVERLEALRETAGKSLDRVDQTLTSVAPQVRRLEKLIEQINDATKDIEEIETRLRQARSTDQAVEQSRTDIAKVSNELRALAAQVSSLSDAAQKSGGAPAASSGPTFAAITEATKRVIESSEAITRGVESAVRSEDRKVVFVQFAGFTREKIDDLRSAMAGSGFAVPPAERIGTALSRFEVRYFYDADKAEAERLAGLATEAVKTRFPGETRAASVVPLTNFKSLPKRGTLELWYGPKS